MDPAFLTFYHLETASFLLKYNVLQEDTTPLWLALETSLTTAEIPLILQLFLRQQPQPRRRAGGAQQGGAG